MLSDGSPRDDLTTDLEVLSGGLVEEITTTQETEADYDTLIQGADRRYPAIILRRKHRGVGATILTISKNGKHAALYAEYESIVQGYIERREARRSGGGGNDPNKSAAAGEGWIDKAIQGVVKRPDNSTGDSDSV